MGQAALAQIEGMDKQLDSNYSLLSLFNTSTSFVISQYFAQLMQVEIYASNINKPKYVFLSKQILETI